MDRFGTRGDTWIAPYMVGAEMFGWMNDKKRHYTNWLLNVDTTDESTYSSVVHHRMAMEFDRTKLLHRGDHILCGIDWKFAGFEPRAFALVTNNETRTITLLIYW